MDNYNQTPKVSNFLPIFESFLGRNNLVTKDTEISQAVNYTFKGNNTQKWLDHVILNKNIIKNVDITILNDSNNRSDHLAINIKLDYNERTNAPSKRTTEYIPKFILNSKSFKTSYESALRIELNETLKLSRNLKETTTPDKLTQIDLIIENISAIILKTAQTTANQYRSSPAFQHIKSKVWWNDECQQLHDSKSELLRIRPRDTVTKREIKIIDNKIAAIKKNWEKRGIRSNAKRLNNLFKLNRNNFWQTMKKLQSNPTEVNLPIEKIKEEFETLFNSKLVVNSTQENEANKKIKEFLAANSNTENHNIDRIAIEASTIKSIIDKLPFNNSGGQSGLTNQLMKVSAIEETIQILQIKHTIQEMIDSAYFPDNFNTAQMFALVKDSKKDSADPNNQSQSPM